MGEECLWVVTSSSLFFVSENTHDYKTATYVFIKDEICTDESVYRGQSGFEKYFKLPSGRDWHSRVEMCGRSSQFSLSYWRSGRGRKIDSWHTLDHHTSRWSNVVISENPLTVCCPLTVWDVPRPQTGVHREREDLREGSFKTWRTVHKDRIRWYVLGFPTYHLTVTIRFRRTHLPPPYSRRGLFYSGSQDKNTDR